MVSPADDGDDVVGLGCGFELAVDAAGVGVEALRGLRGETETDTDTETETVRDISEASSVVVGSIAEQQVRTSISQLTGPRVNTSALIISLPLTRPCSVAYIRSYFLTGSQPVIDPGQQV